jgi:outer membrane usher protein FimD/PapC
LIEGRLVGGGPLPFGADVYDEQNQQIGAVGQGGRLEARVTQAQGQLTVKWGEGTDQRCVLPYAVPADSDHKHKIVQLKGDCTPVGMAAPKLLTRHVPELPSPSNSALRGAVLTIRLPDGSLLPKGARVTDVSGPEGVTGEEGHVYVKPAQVHEGLQASWLDDAAGQERRCRVTMNKPEAVKGTDQCTAIVHWIEKPEISQVSLVDSAH